ncbi:winged helix-turn-helix transcriptional regulator [Natribaculum luteum]|uniref:Winged helix-turn-helix transcriptional regulator n=1 Tax=Natribaculum luteum TaxID=1586232 RepID=A0ABD5P1Q9_9EURY|nr:helix-turn-helix domain-containing protein [Natribaculum luteum]
MSDTDWQATWHSLRELLGSKWSFHVLRLLRGGSYGFNEMQRELDGLTAAVLSRRLKELECHGLVDRSVEATTPPTTTYRLTDSGQEVTRLLSELEDLVDVRDCERDEASPCRGVREDACVTVADCCD